MRATAWIDGTHATKAEKANPGMPAPGGGTLHTTGVNAGDVYVSGPYVETVKNDVLKSIHEAIDALAAAEQRVAKGHFYQIKVIP